MTGHGEKDEKERPGITGSNTEGVQTTDDTGCSSRVPGDQTADNGKPEAAAEGEVTVARAGIKRAADAGTDDSSRGDRVGWRNFIEPGSSSQAPSGQQATGHIIPPSEAVDGSAIPGAADTPQDNVGGGTRFLEEHAVMECDGKRDRA